jgi:glycosyltransferase involved in cell wall biosynthesis
MTLYKFDETCSQIPMNILFLMISYPDIKYNSSMYTDLAQEFASNGNRVFVAVANGNIQTSLKEENGIIVMRVRTMELFNTSFMKKGLANVLLPFQVASSIKKYWIGIGFDSIIVSTPPITYLSTIVKLRKRLKCRVYLVLRDIFPQNAIDLGILKNKVLLKCFRKQERNLYSVANHIGCMSQGNIEYVRDHNREIDQSKLHLLPNWKNVTEYSNPEPYLKAELGLENKFIAIYGGNLGKPQNIDFILDLAKKNIYRDNVVFLIIGEGSEKRRITDLVLKNKLHNVLIKDQLPQKRYQEIVKICDIGLISLSDKFSIPNVPSRTLSYWEAKLPVLAAIDKHTDFNNILDQSGSGLWSISGDIESYKQNFDKLYLNKELRASMGENGYKYLLENCTTSKAFSIINEKLTS